MGARHGRERLDHGQPWVVDKDANGYTVVAHVETDYGKVRECRSLLYEQKGDDIGRIGQWSRWHGVSGGDCLVIHP